MSSSKPISKPLATLYTMRRTRAPVLPSGYTKYEERTRRERAQGRFPCRGPHCDFHGASANTLQRHHNVQSTQQRWACLTCERIWCNGRAAKQHTCEPLGHEPFQGPAQKDVVCFDPNQPGPPLNPAQLLSVYNLFPSISQPLGTAIPPPPMHPGLNTIQLTNPPPPPTQQTTGVSFTFQAMPPPIAPVAQPSLPQHVYYPMQQQAFMPAYNQMPLAGSNNHSQQSTGQIQVTQPSYMSAMMHAPASHTGYTGTQAYPQHMPAQPYVLQPTQTMAYAAASTYLGNGGPQVYPQPLTAAVHYYQPAYTPAVDSAMEDEDDYNQRWADNASPVRMESEGEAYGVASYLSNSGTQAATQLRTAASYQYQPAPAPETEPEMLRGYDQDQLWVRDTYAVGLQHDDEQSPADLEGNLDPRLRMASGPYV